MNLMKFQNRMRVFLKHSFKRDKKTCFIWQSIEWSKNCLINLENYNYTEEIHVFVHKNLHEKVNCEVLFDQIEKLWI